MLQPTIRGLQEKDLKKLAKLYAECFAEPPWFEVFNVEDVVQEIALVLAMKDAVTAVAEMHGVVVGAAWGFEVRREADVMALAHVPASAFYVSEIFVAASARGQGLARGLVGSLLKRVSGAECGVVRTSVNQPRIIRLFEGLGWKVVSREEVISEKYINGQTLSAPDTRVILCSS